MPLYEFECPECKARFEKLCELADGDFTHTCPACGTIARKIISPSSFRLAEPFSVFDHDGTLLHRTQTTEKTPPPGYRYENSNLVEV